MNLEMNPTKKTSFVYKSCTEIKYCGCWILARKLLSLYELSVQNSNVKMVPTSLADVSNPDSEASICIKSSSLYLLDRYYFISFNVPSVFPDCDTTFHSDLSVSDTLKQTVLDDESQKRFAFLPVNFISINTRQGERSR